MSGAGQIAPRVILTPVTIANGGTTTAAVDLSTTRLVGFVAPSAWTASTLKVQGSIDGSNFFDIYDSTGTQVSSWSAITATVGYNTDIVNMLNWRWVRLVAGSAQGAARVFTLLSRPFG